MTRRWPLWLQLSVALSLATLVVSFLTGMLVRKFETEYGLAKLRERTQHTMSLIASAAIEAMIIEDTPVLRTIADELIGADPSIRSIRFENEEGRTLVLRMAENAQGEHGPPIRFSETLVYEGEVFGKLEVQLGLESLQRQNEERVGTIRFGALGVLLALLALIVGLLHGLVIRPVNRIHQGLLSLARGEKACRCEMSPYTSRELLRLAESVAELERFQEVLKRSQAGLAEAQRTARLGNWEWDVAHDHLHCSDELYRILGTTREAISPGYGGLLEFVHADDRKHVREAVEETLISAEPCEIEHRIVRPSGLKRFVHQQARVYCRDAAGVTRLAGTLQDVTERKMAERVLKASEERFRNIFELSPVGMVVLDGKWAVREANCAFQSILGYSWEELAELPLTGVIHPEDRAASDRRLRELLVDAGGELIGLESRYLRKDGEVVWARTSAKRLQVGRAESRPDTLAVIEDVTERKKADERLRQSAQVFESTSEGVIITDARGKIRAVNKAFSNVTGYGEEEVIGRSPRLLRSGKHDRRFYASMWTSLEASGRWQGEIWNRRKGGEVFPEWLNISAVRDEQGAVTHYAGVFSDITNIKRSEQLLDYLAHHDALTDLPNRLLCAARLEHALERVRRLGKQLALLFLDVDRFKNINDTLGHPAGDEVLKTVARRLLSCVREEDTVARLGGDEFVAIVEEVAEPQDASLLAQRIIDTVSEPFELEGHETFVTVSIGIVLYPADGRNARVLLKNADTSMYQAKAQGRNTFHFYRPELSVFSRRRFALQSRLRGALERNELSLHYQPQVSLQTGEITGAEVLLRWESPELGRVGPATFIPLAEEAGLIEPIGAWVLLSACAQIRTWQVAGLPSLRVAVNVSGYQIMRGPIVESVAHALTCSGLDPTLLEIEVTEGFFVREGEQAIEKLNALKELGISFAIDDFGTGYSNLSYLKRMPLDRLKMDQSFVRGIPMDTDDATIARTVIALAHGLQLKVLAEGVETQAQLEFLRGEGCEEMQGYLFGPPLPVEEFEERLEEYARCDRSPVVVRSAGPADASRLTEVWRM
jgi:diguanylate cyclase (GGDEF)-like protein/PAS domain S-box-containing protein